MNGSAASERGKGNEGRTEGRRKGRDDEYKGKKKREWNE